MMAAPREDTIRLGELLTGLCDYPAAADIAVRGIAMQSQDIRPGFVFFANRGNRRHGLEFLDDVLKRGAAAVLWDPTGAPAGVTFPSTIVNFALPGLGGLAGVIASRYYGEPSTRMQVCGVTGTNGKTTVSQVLAQVLTENDRACGVVGTLGYGMYGELHQPTHTTPDAVRLQAELAHMRETGAHYVSMEVSSHALDQQRVAGTTFKLAAFTNLTHEHLDYHKTVSSYADAKRKLFTQPGLEYAVINIDDELGRELAASLPAKVQVVGVSLLSERADIRVKKLEAHLRGLQIDVATAWGDGTINTHLLGRFNASNLLVVLGMLLALDVPFDRALAGLENARTVAGRMECFIGSGARPVVIVDYAHTPDALARALESAREHCDGNLWCVFGCGGSRDVAKRALMGRIAATLADRVVVTDDNPRDEDPQAIVHDILAGMPPGYEAIVEHDRSRAVVRAVESAVRGDVVLLAGKGHEEYQLVGSQQLPYSDRETARRLVMEAN